MANTESYERLSTILNSVGDGVIATDPRGLVTFMNSVAETLTGWEMKEGSGKHVTDILDIHVGNAGNLKKSTFLMEILEQGSVPTRESSSASEANSNTYLIAKSGQEIPVDYSITPVVERQTLAHALKVMDNNVAKTAQALKIARSTLYRKLKLYQLPTSDEDPNRSA